MRLKEAKMMKARGLKNSQMVEYILKWITTKTRLVKEIRRTENYSNDKSGFTGNEGQGEVERQKILARNGKSEKFKVLVNEQIM